MDDSWQRDFDEFEATTLPRLKMHGNQIGRDAMAGDKDALGVVKYYEMLHRSFDPMSHEMLKQSLDKYFSPRALNSTTTEKEGE